MEPGARLRRGLLLSRLLVGRGVVRGLGHVARGVLRAPAPPHLGAGIAARRAALRKGSTGRHVYPWAGHWALYSRESRSDSAP